MTPDEAAHAFYGQDEASFAAMIAKLTETDQRLQRVFENVRRRHLDKKN